MAFSARRRSRHRIGTGEVVVGLASLGLLGALGMLARREGAGRAPGRDGRGFRSEGAGHADAVAAAVAERGRGREASHPGQIPRRLDRRPVAHGARVFRRPADAGLGGRHLLRPSRAVSRDHRDGLDLRPCSPTPRTSATRCASCPASCRAGRWTSSASRWRASPQGRDQARPRPRVRPRPRAVERQCGDEDALRRAQHRLRRGRGARLRPPDAGLLFFTLCAIVFLILALAAVVLLPIALEFVGLGGIEPWLLVMRWPLLLVVVAGVASRSSTATARAASGRAGAGSRRARGWRRCFG